MSGLWIVQRPLEELMQLPPDRQPAPAPDRSIVVDAMAEFIRTTGSVPGMPTIRFTQGRECLSDGSALLAALFRAGYRADVACIWRSEGRHSPPNGEPFTAQAAEAIGSPARILVFEHPLTSSQEDVLMKRWTPPPKRIGSASFSWAPDSARELSDWLTWMRELEELLPQLPPLEAINGRR